jgi:hypothetical protein
VVFLAIFGHFLLSGANVTLASRTHENDHFLPVKMFHVFEIFCAFYTFILSGACVTLVSRTRKLPVLTRENYSHVSQNG